MALLKKIITSSEEKWSFIQIQSNLVSKFPEKFELHYNDKVFQVKINSKGRMISKKLMDSMRMLYGDTIQIDKNDEKYSISKII